MQKPSNPKLLFWSGIIGNTLDHYDSALYIFLVPIFAPIFFPKSDPIVALILAFGIKSTTIIARPIGALIFGNLALKYSTKNLLSLTLSGVAICTFFIGTIPTYNDIGLLAPILLTLVRTIQGIFGAGEYTIATMFVLEQVKDESKIGKASSIYLFSTMSGSLLACGVAALVSKSTHPEIYWRYAFLIGIITAITGLFLRLMVDYPKQTNLTTAAGIQPSFTIIYANKLKLLKIMILSSFTYITYIIPFIFLNNFIPLISPIKMSDLLVHTTILLVINNAMLPLVGSITDKFNFAKWMATMSFLVGISIVPIFYLLPHLDIMGINIAKLWIIILGVGFSAPFNAFLFKMTKGSTKYLITGFGYSLGSELLGRNASVICLSLWYYFGNLLAPSLYLAFISFLATFILIREARRPIP